MALSIQRSIRAELMETAKFVFVDLETTGLDSDNDLLLEVAVAVVDREGQILATFDSLVDHNISADELVGMMPPVVEEMHLKSGLMDEWERLHRVQMDRDPSGETSESHHRVVESAAVQFLADCGLPFGKFSLAGSSVHFDREFCIKQMPTLNGFFHYRNIDVSTLMQLCREYNEPVAAAYEKFVDTRELDGGDSLVHHRALDDIRSSIQELMFYKDNFLFVA